MSEKKVIELIMKIVERAEKMQILMFDGISLLMDLEVAHKQFDLRLEELLNADNINFIHDICGIQQHINRQTKEIEDCFLPRYAR